VLCVVVFLPLLGSRFSSRSLLRLSPLSFPLLMVGSLHGEGLTVLAPRHDAFCPCVRHFLFQEGEVWFFLTNFIYLPLYLPYCPSTDTSALLRHPSSHMRDSHFVISVKGFSQPSPLSHLLFRLCNVCKTHPRGFK